MAVLESKINIRLSNDNKEKINKAANINNLSLSSYVLHVTLKQAEYDIREHQVIKVSEKAINQLTEALTNPPKPNAKLKKLLASKL